MKKLLLILLATCGIHFAYCQKIEFETTNLETKEEKSDNKITVNFIIVDGSKDIDVTIEPNEDVSSATKDKDYSIENNLKVKVEKSKGYKGKFEITIKSDKFTEYREELHLKLKFKDDKDKDQEQEYVIYINDINDGNSDEPKYTEAEKNVLRGLSLDVYGGGNLDFFEKLHFHNLGGELVINMNSLCGGPEKRWGGFLGISNFQNFTYDSSNRAVRVQNIRIDTGAYINGVTRYLQRTFVDHRKVSTNQWSYYINPTCRINDGSDLFNIYVSARFEIQTVSIKNEFITDTLNFSDTTNRPLGASPVFQSGNGFLLQKATEQFTNGYYSLGFPMYVNAKGKFKFYFDPNVGVAWYNFSAYMPQLDGTGLQKVTISETKPFYLAKFRVTDQFTGLNITVGGEARKVANFRPTINLYLGLRIDLVNWFNKVNNS